MIKTPKLIRLNEHNILKWPSWKMLLDEGKIKFDINGQLRYLHGAPVGDLVLVKFNKDEFPVYKELADEWFDPNSQKALDFKWPK